MNQTIISAYLAPKGHTQQLLGEISNVCAVYDRLVLARGAVQESCWAQNIWYAVREIPVKSVSDAARRLKSLQRNWCCYSFKLHRRAMLVQDLLPHVSSRPLKFPAPVPNAPLGSWTMLNAGTLLAAERCASPFPNGEIQFEECKTGPPNRAYLKLWEVFTRFGAPRPGSLCLDAGGSPGGWAWVLQRVGCKVLSVDRSNLDPSVARLDRVEFKKGDAFSVKPGNSGSFDWIFWDVACYPQKLFNWAREWLDSGACRRFVCTLKFQGKGDYRIVEEFLRIKDSQVLHLFHNKHELTFVHIPKVP